MPFITHMNLTPLTNILTSCYKIYHSDSGTTSVINNDNILRLYCQNNNYRKYIQTYLFDFDTLCYSWRCRFGLVEDHASDDRDIWDHRKLLHYLHVRVGDIPHNHQVAPYFFLNLDRPT